MEHQRKDNTGAIFKNDRKESDSHPDYKGQAMIDGSEYWISVWFNKSKAGNKYMSVKFNPKDLVQSNGIKATIEQSINQQLPTQEFEDDIPF